MYKYSYAAFVSNGLGTSYSSLQQTGPLYAYDSFGHGKLNLAINLANGNLVMQDRKIRMHEDNFPLEFYYTYNSLLANMNASPSAAWQFSLKRFTQLPSSDAPGSTAVLKEEDGHVTTYTQSPDNPSLYLAPGSADGTPRLQFNHATNVWEWRHPGTLMLETYDNNGNLLTRVDSEGRATQFYYTNGNLSSITTPSGNNYSFRGDSHSIGIFLNNIGIPLIIYHFDDLGRLTASQTNDGYLIQYVYTDNTARVDHVVQSDGALLTIATNNDGTISRFKLGDDDYCTPSYPTSDNPNQATLQDGNYSETTVTFDNNFHITEIDRVNAYNDYTPIDVSKYSYYPSGQLATETHPNSGVDTYIYDPDYGVLTAHIEPNGQYTEKAFIPDKGTVRLKTLIQHYDAYHANVTPDESELAVTRFVYDIQYKGNNTFTRFKISPEGRVTEYRPDLRGNIASVRVYLDNVYDLSTLGPSDAPTLSDMLAFVAKQNPQRIQLTEYLYNLHGEPSFLYEYANIDAQGNGVHDEALGETTTFCDGQGNIELKIEKQSSAAAPTTFYDYDELKRLIRVCDPLENVTTYQYNDANSTVLITYPNGRTETSTYDNQGRIFSHVQSAMNSANQAEVRTTTIARDANGLPIITTKPDGNKEYQFFDQQTRLGFTVTPLGIVSETRRNKQNRYELTTDYANPVDTTKIQPYPDILPEAQDLQALLQNTQDPTIDRYAYRFYDQSERLIYTVDAMLNVTQFFYDNLNQKIASARYKDKLTSDQLTALINGQSITLTPDPKKDRCARVFYDKDGLVIGEQDAAGYLTEYKRNAGGRIWQKVVYYTPLDINFTANLLTDLSIPLSEKDAKTHYFHDARGHVIAEIDPEMCFTQYTYYSNGEKKSEIHYATKATTLSSAPPISSLEDQVTKYALDLLNRPVSVALPFQTLATKQYDNMGNLLASDKQDRLQPNKTDGDSIRGTQAQYDGWGQANREANPYVNQLLLQATSPDQKQKIWNVSATQSIFDSTGLRIKSIDNFGQATYYFYDEDRRLILTVDPLKLIREVTLNSFSEEMGVRQYATSVPEALYTTLTGGFLTPDLRAAFTALQSNDKDHLASSTRDKCGNRIGLTDSGGYQSTFTYNSFNQCEVEALPLTSTAPEITITHTFDTRGLEIATQKQGKNGTVCNESRAYQSPYRLPTSHIDARGATSTYEYNKAGDLAAETNGLGAKRSILARDGLRRILQETDREANVINHAYAQEQRTHTTQFPVAGTATTVTANSFGEAVKQADGLGNAKQWQHEPDGQVSAAIDEVGNTVNDKHDLQGKLLTHTDEKKVTTKNAYDNDGQLTQQTFDSGTSGANLTTTYNRDNFGNPIDIVNPRQVHQTNQFDKRNNLISSTIDPSTTINPNGLNLVTSQIVNAQGSMTSQTKGNLSNGNQWQEGTSRDDLNREIGKVVDPAGLNINNQMVLNAAGDTIANIDPLGHTTWQILDALGRKRFEVNARGGVTEWQYDNNNREVKQRNYQKNIDPSQINKSTTVAQMTQYVHTGPEDCVSWIFRDDNGRERFSISMLGVVKEKLYNNAGKITETIHYKTKIPTADLDRVETAYIATLMLSKTNAEDRHFRYILDECGQERFVIDPDIYIIEQVFDERGKVISKTAYAAPVADPAALMALKWRDVSARLLRSIDLDRTTYNVFNAKGKPWFTVNVAGLVTRFDYDETFNLVKTIEFSQKFVAPTDYNTLVTQLKNLTPDPKADRIREVKYDNADRRYQDTTYDYDNDSSQTLVLTDAYVLTALGDIEAYTDANKATWTYQHDRACRLQSETSPAYDNAIVTIDPVTGTLKKQVVNKSVTKLTERDAASNTTAITEASGTDQARKVSFSHDVNNQLTGTTIAGVKVDINNNNPSTDTVQASFTARPEVAKDITRTLIYDFLNRKVAEQDEEGRWTFYVFDADGNEVYHVNPDKSVRRRYFNAFGDKIAEINYATKIGIDDLSPYTQTGIPLDKFSEPGVIVTAPDDRKSTSNYDKRGNEVHTGLKVTTDEQEEIQPSTILRFYRDGLTSAALCDRRAPRTKREMDAFGNCVKESRLITTTADVDASNDKWSDQYRWYDGANHIVATVDPDNYPTFMERNTFGDEAHVTQYANKLSGSPATAKTIADLKKLLQPDVNYDREVVKQYNLRGLPINEVYRNLVIQRVVMKDGERELESVIIPEATRKIVYSANNLPTVLVDESGAKIYQYYNAIGKMIARTGVARTSMDDNNNPITIVPFTTYGVDPFGVQVSEERYLQGTTNPNANTLPVAKAPSDPNNQYEMQYMNQVGQVAQNQDAKGVQHGTTYTATRQKARLFEQRTNPNEPVHMDEERQFYNEMNMPSLTRLVQDNSIVQETANLYSLFSEKTGEGPNDGTYPKFWKYNAAGFAYSSNEENGVVTINLPDLMGRSVVQIKARDIDLSTYNEANLDNIVQAAILAPDAYVKRESIRDARGDIVVKVEPNTPAANTGALNLPTCMQVRQPSATGACIIAWPIPQERNVSPSVTIKTRNGQVNLPNITPTNADGYYTIDLSNQPTDIYTYEIAYTFNVPTPNGGTPVTMYHTAGDIQVITNNVTNSVNVVSYVKNNSLLYFTGNISGLSGVNLLLNGQVVAANLPVRQDASQHYYVDLTAYASGAYTIQPLFSNGRTEGPGLPFTIYTLTPSLTPLAREISSTVSVGVTDKDGVLTWAISPDQFNNQPVKISCDYVGDDDKNYTLPDTTITRDAEGKFTFDNSVKAITSLTLSVQLANDEWLELFSGITPVSPFNQIVNDKLQSVYAWSKKATGAYEKKYFHESNAGPAGNDGFESLNTDRNSLCDQIERLLPQAPTKAAIAKDIFDALKEGIFKAPDSDWIALSKQHRSAEDELAIAKTSQSIKWEEVIHKESALAEAHLALKNYTLQPHVQAQYVQQLREHLPLGWRTALEFSHATQQSLTIWKRDTLNPGEIKLCSENKVEGSHGKDWLLYNNALHYQSISSANSSYIASKDAHAVLGGVKNDEGTVQANFDAQSTLYVVPLKFPVNVTPNLEIRNDKLDILQQTTTLACVGITTEGASYNVTGMLAGIYTYTLDNATQTLTVGMGGQEYASNPAASVRLDEEKRLEETITSYHQLAYDRWQNVVSETDSLGHLTSQVYNKRNQCTRLSMPETDIYPENGIPSRGTPTKLKGYDLLGNLIGTKNANGYVDVYTVDEAGQLLQVSVDDEQKTIVKDQIYDGFGRRWKLYDARKKATHYTFDKGNCVTAMQLPSGRTFRYGYNERNQRTSTQDPTTNLPLLHYYDVRKDLVRTVLPDGVSSLWYEYDRNHMLLKQLDEQRRPISWTRNYFGVVQSHIDLGNATYLFDYNKLNLPIHESSSGGNHGNMMQVIYAQGRNGVSQMSVSPATTPGKNITKTYYGDLMMSMTDNAVGAKKLSLQYDSERRPVVLDTTNEKGQAYRHVEARYDEHGRDSYQLDREMIVVRGYDAEGNTRFTRGKVYPDGFNAPSINTESWNRFDAANRVLQQDGTLSNGVITGGQQFTYKDNLRNTEIDRTKSTTLTYNDDRQLTDTNSGVNGSSHRDYDPSGWVKNYQSQGVTRTLEWNANGWITKDVQHVGNGNDPLSTTTFTNLVGDGQAKNQETINKVPGQKRVRDVLELNYVEFDSYQQWRTKGTRWYDGDHGDYSTAEELYDANGTPNAILGSFSQSYINQPSMQDPYSFYLTTTPDGIVVAKQTISTRHFYKGGPFTSSERFEYFTDIHANQMGVYSKTVANVGLEQYLVGASGGLKGQFAQRGGTLSKSRYDSVAGGNVTTRNSIWSVERVSMPSMVKPVAPAMEQFKQPDVASIMGMIYASGGITIAPESYAVSGMSFPPMGPQYYVVKAGDTWESIAEGRYQDSSRGENLAEENGMIGGQLSAAMARAKPKVTILNLANDATHSFIRYPVLGDGDCGYTAIESTRSGAHLLLGMNVAAIKDMIAPAVKEQLLNWNFVGHLYRQHYSNSALLEAYLAYRKASDENQLTPEIENNLMCFAADVNVVQGYLKFDIVDKQVDGGYAHPLVLKAVGHLRGHDVKIWNVNQENKLVLQYGETPVTNAASPCMHLLYSRGKLATQDHFDRLVDVSTLSPTQFARLEIEGISLTDTNPLMPGMRIRTPFEMPQKNNAWTHLPADALMGYIVGSLCPKLKLPEPDDDDDFFSSVLPEIAGVIAGAIVTWLLPPVGGYILTTMLAAGAAAAVTDAIVQEVQVVLGVRDHFSLREAIDVGLSAGITAGFLAPAGGLFSGFSTADIATQFLEAGVVSVTNELKSMLIDNTKKFNLQEVVANTFAIVAGTRVGNALKASNAKIATSSSGVPVANAGIANLSPTLAIKMQTYLANAVIDTLSNAIADPEHISLSRIAARSIGQAVGNTIVQTAEEAVANMKSHTEAAMDGNHRQLKQAANAESAAPSENRTKQKTANDAMMEKQRETRSQRWNQSKVPAWAEKYMNTDLSDYVADTSVSTPSPASTSESVSAPPPAPVGAIQTAKNRFWLAVGLINGTGEGVAKTFLTPILHPDETFAGLVNTAYDLSMITNGMDYNGQSRAHIMAIGSNMWQGMKNTWQGMNSDDPYTRGYYTGVGLANVGMLAAPFLPTGVSLISKAGEVVRGADLGSIEIFAPSAGSKPSLFRMRGSLGEESVAKTMRFTELASGTRADIRALLKSGTLELPAEQIDKILYNLGSGRMDKVTLKLMNTGDVRIVAERAGRASGYQRMSLEVDQMGRTNKVVQTAFDDANKLVPQKPGQSKNNLYDVKKWNKNTY